ncbi:hypothetical protein Hanom_Chr02g00099911 [Helianthus anomalus]
MILRKRNLPRSRILGERRKGLAPAVITRRPKPEPKDTSNPDDPIDLESSPEHLVRSKAGKRKQTGAEAEGQPAKKIQRKKITRKGNLDAFISESAPRVPTSPISPKPLPVFNEELPPSPPRASVVDQLKATEVPEGGVEKVVEADKPVDVAVETEKVVSPEAGDDAGIPQVPEPAAYEKEKTAEEIPVTASPSKVSGSMRENIEKVSTEDQGSFSDVGKNSPIRPR